jgi:hypothetical protein
MAAKQSGRQNNGFMKGLFSHTLQPDANAKCIFGSIYRWGKGQ